MRVLSYLVLLLMFSVASAQTPTILQGDYISNVFGNSNFILNPNAQTSNCTTSGTITCANVTVTNASITRVTTTPLVARSEFNVAIGTANGTATWATRAFDAGMKGQNCEARFTYRGFAATSKVHIKQSTNTVASLNLTPATDPRIASINFPCGDLSQPTTFVVTDTAILAGTNEISGIYTGLATNQANVAQAENVVQASRSTTQSFPTVPDTAIIFTTETKDVYGEFDTANGRFTAKRAGDYLVSTTWLSDLVSWTSGSFLQLSLTKNASNFCRSYNRIESTQTMNKGITTTCVISLAVGDYIESKIAQNQATMNSIADGSYVFTSISRFPTSSELVVTPERQNTFAGVRLYSNSITNAVTSGTVTKLTTSTSATRTSYGKADTTATDDLSLTIKNLPVGSYKIEATGTMFARATSAGTTAACIFSLSDSATAGSPLASMYQNAYGDASTATQDIIAASTSGIYVNTSVADRTFFVRAQRAGGTGSCLAYSDNQSPFNIIVTPLDQPSNSALYVQGPVLAAATGAAIPAGYVFEQTSSNPGITITNNAAAVQNITSFTLNPGVWMVEATCAFRSNTTTATTTWNFAAAMIADANNSTAGTDDMSYSYAFLGHINVASQYYPIFIKRYINVTSATTYYLNTQNSYGANNPSVACNLKRTRIN